MTNYIHHLVFGLSISAANLKKMQIIGVIIYVEGISNADRLALFTGTIADLAALKLLYPSLVTQIDAASKEFQAVFSTSATPNTQDYYIGHVAMTDNHWNRLSPRLASLNGTLKWARWGMVTDSLDPNFEKFLLTSDNNVSALSSFVGTALQPIDALSTLGLLHYIP